MDAQNVSAQLYFKQLPEDANAGPIQTDAQIENAFQNQLNLSEYYKSPVVFETMKNDYMNKTEEGQANNQPEPTAPPPKMPIAPPGVPIVGPTDFLKKYIKEGFGGTGIFFTILIAVIVILFLWFIFKKNINIIKQQKII